MTMEMESNKKTKHGGSVIGRENIRRRRQESHHRLMLDYFGVPGFRRVFPKHYFRRRFCMGTDLLIYIYNVIKQKDTFFKQKRNCTGFLGHSTLQKMTAALPIMAYGITRTSTTIIVSLEGWCNLVGEKIASSTSFKFTMRFEIRILINDSKKISLRSGGNGVVIKILELSCLVFRFSIKIVICFIGIVFYR